MSTIYKSGILGYIFRCTNETEDECFKRMLFGEIPKYGDKVSNVKIGNSLFLLNVTSGRFYGEFRAKSDGGFNLDKDAWGGRFPWQVRIERVADYLPISKSEVQKVVEFRKKFKGTYPVAVLSEDQIKELRDLFEKKKELPKVEETFREKYPAKIRSDDGHFVRSLSELTIDNWLFTKKISHGYERRLPVEENVYCDFYLQSGDEYVYIEFWGLADEEYEKRKKQKTDIYNKYNFPLIQLFPKDLDNLDEVLPQHLMKRFLGHKF